MNAHNLARSQGQRPRFSGSRRELLSQRLLGVVVALSAAIKLKPSIRNCAMNFLMLGVGSQLTTRQCAVAIEEPVVCDNRLKVQAD